MESEKGVRLCAHCGHLEEYHQPWCERLVRDFGVTTRCHCIEFREEAS
jgi:hypothetical protein